MIEARNKTRSIRLIIYEDHTGNLEFILDLNKNIQDGRDRSRVDGNENYELSYLEERLGITREQVKEAIQAVGNNRDEVEEYLKKNK